MDSAGRTQEMFTMDGQRFDAWTRTLASGLPRRAALRALAGFGIATAATHSALGEAAACSPIGEDCSKDMPCCDGASCKGGTCSECEVDPQTNECVNSAKCEAKDCKKNKKKKKGKKKGKRKKRGEAR
jgi:hypothetical protein